MFGSGPPVRWLADYEDEMTLMQPERRRGLGEGLDRLSPEEAWLLRERLKGLYAMLKKHPALMDRRLQVGSKKPQIPTHHRQHFYDVSKRERERESVCVLSLIHI